MRLSSFIKPEDKGKLMDSAFTPIEKSSIVSYHAQCTAEVCNGKDCTTCPHFRCIDKRKKEGKVK